MNAEMLRPHAAARGRSEVARLLRDVCVNASLSIPPVRRLRTVRKLSRGYDPMKDQASYPASVFEHHRSAIPDGWLRGRSLLEIGPGGNYGVAFLFLLSGGARATCIDVTDWGSKTAPSLYLDLARDFCAEGADRAEAAASDALGRLDVVIPADVHAMPFPDETFDYVYSQASFEHFGVPRQAIREIARVLKPGGLTTHQIDLRDHRSFERPLDFLHHSRPIWHLATSRRTCFTNRMRASEYREEFEAAGLHVLRLDPTEKTAVSEQARSRFSREFRNHTLEDLSTVGIFIGARRVDPHSAALGTPA